MDLDKLTTEQINGFSAAEGRKALETLREESLHPMEINEALLMQMLEHNKDTEFGRKYDFATIHSIEEYQKRVPVSIYDDYAGDILRMVNNDEDNLITAYDIGIYCETSGSLGNPKLIPMAKDTMRIHNFYNSGICSGVKAEHLRPEWTKGRAMMLMECKTVEMKKGKEYGSLSALFMREMKPIVDKISSTPFEAIFPQKDTDTRYLQARFALAEPDLAQISCTFLSFAAELLRYIENYWPMLVADIEAGVINAEIHMPQEVRDTLMQKITPMPERAAELRSIFSQGFDTPFIPKVWPKLQLISGVGTGAFEIYEQKIRERYADDSMQFFFSGISATEGCFSVSMDMDCKNSALLPNSMFYEFLPVDAHDDFSQIVTMDKVEVGKDYEIIMTNFNGLYRYRMRDCIRIMDKYNELPLIRFQYRIDQVADIIDDHTTEQTFTKVATDTAEQLGLDLVDYSVYPDTEAPLPRYIYLLELGKDCKNGKKEDIRRTLHENLVKYSPDIEGYMEKGIGGQTALEILQPETYMFYYDLMALKGRNPAQIKPVHIINNEIHRRLFFKLIEKDWGNGDEQ